MNKRILILAGPNGAGKTTFAREFLVREGCPAFLNADLIAAGLSPFDPGRVALRSGRLMLELIAEHVARGENFAFETTLAGRNFARAIEQWRSAGYHVSLIFLSLPSPELAVQRIAQRVRQGGHDVPDDVVRRRFNRGRDHFETLYKPLVDTWMLYDNAGDAPILISSRRQAMTVDATRPRLRSQRWMRFAARGYVPSKLHESLSEVSRCYLLPLRPGLSWRTLDPILTGT
jgi:predicted ABC-type ATPase